VIGTFDGRIVVSRKAISLPSRSILNWGRPAPAQALPGACQMKLLILHCREFGFELNKKGKLAEDPGVGLQNRKIAWFAMVCVEKGDSLEKVPAAAKEIASIADSVASKNIVIFLSLT